MKAATAKATCEKCRSGVKIERGRGGVEGYQCRSCGHVKVGRGSGSGGGNSNGGGRAPKYGNERAEVDGITFDSRLEARRWQELLLLERAGEIRQLQRQVRFPLEVNGLLVCTYVADFVYYEEYRGWGGSLMLTRRVVEDAKGHRTREYLLKKKLLKAIHGIEIRETTGASGAASGASGKVVSPKG